MPYATLSPTNVNTKEAKIVYTSSPLADQNSLFPLTKIINTGRARKIKNLRRYYEIKFEPVHETSAHVIPPNSTILSRSSSQTTFK